MLSQVAHAGVIEPNVRCSTRGTHLENLTFIIQRYLMILDANDLFVGKLLTILLRKHHPFRSSWDMFVLIPELLSSGPKSRVLEEK